jgi:hypothetical protein
MQKKCKYFFTVNKISKKNRRLLRHQGAQLYLEGLSYREIEHYNRGFTPSVTG